MPDKQRKITEVLMECPECPWMGRVIECDCDADIIADVKYIFPIKIVDEGRLRCPKCGSVVNQIGEG